MEKISKSVLKGNRGLEYSKVCSLVHRLGFLRSHEPHTRLSAALTAALYYRVKDKRLLPPVATSYLQLTIYWSMVSWRKEETAFGGRFCVFLKCNMCCKML